VPNLPAHIDFAHTTAQQLGHPTLDDNLGHFLLGSTSPDIRVITRKDREEYHFAPLDFDDVGAGIDRMFDSHPDLMSAGDYSGQTQAFIAGYLTHLVVDETWITTMFRPYFGNPVVFEDEVLGLVMDRALQMELDRQAWETATAIRSRLEAASERVEIGFIPSETLEEWRLWVLGSLDRGFSWNRLRFMARRIAAGDDGHPAHQVADDFVQSMPGSLETLCESVPGKDLTNLKDRTIQSLVRVVGDYLP
jgi:hypothetical protein